MNCPHNLTKTLKYRFNMGDEMSTEDDIKKIFEDRLLNCDIVFAVAVWSHVPFM